MGPSILLRVKSTFVVDGIVYSCDYSLLDSIVNEIKCFFKLVSYNFAYNFHFVSLILRVIRLASVNVGRLALEI